MGYSLLGSLALGGVGDIVGAAQPIDDWRTTGLDGIPAPVFEGTDLDAGR